MKEMQRLATRVFITASILFGTLGVIAMLSTTNDDDPPVWLMKILGACGFIVLSSFGVSVGLKYLSDK